MLGLIPVAEQLARTASLLLKKPERTYVILMTAKVLIELFHNLRWF
jgi:hypothetical protein